MLRVIVSLLIVLSCLMPEFSHAGYEEGYEAAKKGLYKVALVEFQAAAEKGDARAQYSLGIMYHDGIGVKKNSEIAMKWIKKAADKGHPIALQMMKRK